MGTVSVCFYVPVKAQALFCMLTMPCQIYVTTKGVMCFSCVTPAWSRTFFILKAASEKRKEDMRKKMLLFHKFNSERNLLMKPLFLRTLSLLFLLTFLFSFVTLAEENGLYALYAESPDSMCIRISAKEIRRTDDLISFKNTLEADSSLYILNRDTVYEDTAEKAAEGLAAFCDGTKTEITVYIPKSQYYLFSQKENAEVSVQCVPSFQKDIAISLPDALDPFAVLEAFSVIEETDDRNAPVLRGKLADLLVRAHRIDASTVSLEPNAPFSDVSAEHPFYDSIRVAKAIGILNGYGDGTFRPDAPLSGKECIKAVVALLGYTPLAEARGGYPNGYIKVAAQIGLTKDISLDVSAPVPLSAALKLIKNAIYLPDMVQTVYKEDAAEYDVMDGTNGKPYLRFYDRYYR